MVTAPLIEVFSSVQGEGPYVGCRHLFVRFAGCNLSCAYCDTPTAAGRYCRIEQTPGRGDYRMESNPVTVDLLLAHTVRAAAFPHHALALTGGEPLLHSEFLRGYLERFRVTGLPCYLETNGTLPEALARVSGLVDIVAMDVKLPSVSGSSFMEAEHRRFLETALPAGVFVKAVVGQKTPDGELERMYRLIAGVSADILVVLQPVTVTGGGGALAAERLLAMQALGLRYLRDVRIIPQAHRILGVP